MINIKRKACEMKAKLDGNTWKYKDKLTEWQWLSKEDMQALQNQRLKALLRHAYQHVPYYREVLEKSAVVDNDGIVMLDRFKDIKILDRSTIMEQFERLKSKDIDSRSPYKNSSGGSTGVPVQMMQDKDFLDWTIAIKMLNDEWSGMYTADRRAYVWGSIRDALVGKETVKTYLGRWMRNEMWVNTFRMTQEQMKYFVLRLNEFKPVQILAFAENIYELARYIERNGISIHQPKAIMSSAGVLYPHMRETIERVFKAPVFNRYGSREVGDIACECSHHNGLHISSPTHFIEVLRPDGTSAQPGEIGEIVVTLLINYSMPLIRYRIGDLGVISAEDCACGRGTPLLKDIVGRSSDMFINKSGDHIDGRIFLRMLVTRPFIQKFQVIQEDYDRIKIIMVPFDKQINPKEVYANELRAIMTESKTLMGEDCDIQYEFVNEIETTKSGKYRFIISKVQA